eukprot:210257_1
MTTNGKSLLIYILFGIITILLVYRICKYVWYIVIILYLLLFVICKEIYFVRYNHKLNKLLLLFVLLTTPQLYAVYDTAKTFVFRPKRLVYRFNCYYRRNYYKYQLLIAKQKNQSSHIYITKYHTLNNATHIFSASLYGSDNEYFTNI